MSAARMQGVSLHKPTGKWHARIMDGGKRKSLGYFDTAEEAAQAYRDNKPDTRVKVKRKVVEAKALAETIRQPIAATEALASEHFLGVMGDGGAYNPLDSEEFALVAQVARDTGVSSWHVSEVFMACEGLIDTIAGEVVTYELLKETVELVRSRGMLHRVSEYADRAAMFEDSPEAALDVMLETDEPPPASRMDQWRFHVAAMAQREVWREVWGEEKYRARDQAAGRLGVPIEDVVAEIDAGRMSEPVAGPKRLPYRAGPLETAKREAEVLAHGVEPADDLV